MLHPFGTPHPSIARDPSLRRPRCHSGGSEGDRRISRAGLLEDDNGRSTPFPRGRLTTSRIFAMLFVGTGVPDGPPLPRSLYSPFYKFSPRLCRAGVYSRRTKTMLPRTKTGEQCSPLQENFERPRRGELCSPARERCYIVPIRCAEDVAPYK